jgi:ATP-dependent DNA helicase PIF1
LVRGVYGDDMAEVSRSKNLILALTLEACDKVNSYCLERLTGDLGLFTLSLGIFGIKINTNVTGDALVASAFDDMTTNRDLDAYPPEYIANLTLHGVPPSNLNLKVKGRYMIMKNYDGKRGAINGTLCEMMKCPRHVLQVRLLTGNQEGRIIMLPRCSFTVTTENSGLPFQFCRVQFPIIPAYCVTVHKAQGQSLVRAGLYIDRDCFTHGQLYTALSRVGGWDKLAVLLLTNDKFLRNVVKKYMI